MGVTEYVTTERNKASLMLEERFGPIGDEIMFTARNWHTIHYIPLPDTQHKLNLVSQRYMTPAIRRCDLIRTVGSQSETCVMLLLKVAEG